MNLQFRATLIGLILLLTAAIQADAVKPVGTSFSHDDYDALLKKFVYPGGLVDYKGLISERKLLDDYVMRLGDVSPREVAHWSQADQIAFYINAYNSITLKRIIDNYPPKGMGILHPKISIRNISGVWNEITNKVAGRMMTLDHIEHEILRKRFNEPRIHLAVNCASLGCPPLRADAYTGANLEAQLEDQAKQFAADDTRNKVDQDSGVLYLSAIFDWFEEDFDSYAANLPEGLPNRLRGGVGFMIHYASVSRASFLRKGDFRVKVVDYDWSLNEWTKSPSSSPNESSSP